MAVAKPILGYPSRTAAVVALRREGLTLAEVAARTGIPVSNVSALECCARRRRAAWLPRTSPGGSCR
ncbi:MAG TPA: hypothetical protein VGB90_09570 [Alphaproteobacteria bacterium]|jgi:DNA-directed RNA polymerase specialized sigma24 family protein